MKESLAFARSAARHDSMKVREMREATHAALATFRQGLGAARKQQVVAAMPALGTLALRAEPIGACTVLSVEPPDGASMADAVACAYRSAKRTNLSAALEKDWQQLHRIVQLSDAVPRPPTLDTQQTKCYLAGMCLCRGAGLTVAAIGAAFLRKMKRLFAKPTGRYDMLLEGRIVVRIDGAPATEDYTEIMQMEQPFATECYHIGLQYLKPYRPAFLKVESTQAGGEALASDGRLYVKAKLGRCMHANRRRW